VVARDAGAAAVLLGLVFIALSLHLEKPQAPGVPVLGLGSQALINLIYVLLLSLGMLVPYRPPVLPGIAVLAVAAVGLNDSATTVRRARRPREPPLTIRDLAVPVLLPIGWFLLLVVGGVGVIARQPFGLYLLAAGSAALIAAQLGTPGTCWCSVAPKDLSERGAWRRALSLQVDTRPFFVDRAST
jgi:ribose/xylose/arabinose/galactoside ABC-type transport system permease subunit